MSNENNYIHAHNSIKEALEQLNKVPEGMVLFVLDAKERLVGTLTDGDVRRGLLAGKTIDQPVEVFMHREFRYLRKNKISLQEVEALRQKLIRQVPLLDEQGQIIRLLNLKELRSVLPLEVVIMAGGRGERLKPHTNSTPKPLLKVGDTPILEHMLRRLAQYGIQDITLAVRYLGQQIRDYFGDGSRLGLSIRYLQEAEPMGTIGALAQLPKPATAHVLLMNSDLLTNLDFEEFYAFHEAEGADVSVASIPYKVTVPYAVLETREHHTVTALQEKPTYTYYANAGIYLLKREMLRYLPQEGPCDAPDFLDLLLQKGYKVAAFPIHGYWLDIGKPQDYARAQEDIKHIKF